MGVSVVSMRVDVVVIGVVAAPFVVLVSMPVTLLVLPLFAVDCYSDVDGNAVVVVAFVVGVVVVGCCIGFVDVVVVWHCCWCCCCCCCYC